MLQSINNIWEVNKAYYFLFYCFLSVTLIFLSNHILVTEDLYYSFFNEQMSFERISEFIAVSKRIEWVIYLIIPLYLLLKLFVVACCLSTGALLFGYNVNFSKFFYAALFADLVFIIAPILKLIWFGIISTEYSLTDLQYFLPLSALNLFDPSQLESWLVYPLQLLNIFEVLYWCSLAYHLKNILNKDFVSSLGFVASTYGVGLLLWVIIFMFLTVSLS